MASLRPALPPAPTPSITRGVVIRDRGKATIDDAAPVPKLRNGCLLVRTTAVALNHADWKSVFFLLGGDPTGCRVGCDYAGVVLAVGPGITKPWQVGDRVAGVAHGANQSQPEDGTFAEIIVAKADLALKIPVSIKDEDAATLGLGIVAVGQGLYQSLKMRLPTDPLTEPEWILISVGATATGHLGIQLAKMSGYRVVTTLSAGSLDYALELGADQAFHCNEEGSHIASTICTVVGQQGELLPFRLVWDCVGTAESAQFCARVLVEAAQGPDDSDATDATNATGEKNLQLHYRSLLPVDDSVLKAIDDRIDNGSTCWCTAFGEPYEKSRLFPAVPEDFAFARDFWAMVGSLLDKGMLKPARAHLNRGGAGLEGVLVGLQELKAGKVRGGKLVYTIGADVKGEPALEPASACASASAYPPDVETSKITGGKNTIGQSEEAGDTPEAVQESAAANGGQKNGNGKQQDSQNDAEGKGVRLPKAKAAAAEEQEPRKKKKKVRQCECAIVCCMM